MSDNGRDLDFDLTAPQAAFATATEQYPAIVAGFGSGKTQALCARLLIRKVAFPAGRVGYFAPTYDLISAFGMPRIEDMLNAHNLPYKKNENKKTLTVAGYGQFLFRTLEKPERLVGFELSDGGIDEFDTLKVAHAKLAFQKATERLRQVKPFGEVNTLAIATTPEGFRATYEMWEKDPKPGFRLIRASTYSNAHNLAADYIPKLRALYTPELFEAYINGFFRNLTSGSVYRNFSRVLNATKELPRPGERLHIGMDFNIYHMAAVVFVIRNGRPIAVGEFAEVIDTPSMCDAIRTRYGKRHPVTVYPDPSGDNGSSKGAAVSDFVILRAAGFEVRALPAHPTIKNRVAALHGQILNAAGERRLLVNVDWCPNFTRTLEQQVYAPNGDPDKSAGLDHHGDAAGYAIEMIFPIVGRGAGHMPVVGA